MEKKDAIRLSEIIKGKLDRQVESKEKPAEPERRKITIPIPSSLERRESHPSGLYRSAIGSFRQPELRTLEVFDDTASFLEKIFHAVESGGEIDGKEVIERVDHPPSIEIRFPLETP